MSDLLLSHLVRSISIDFSTIQQRKSHGCPLLLSSLGAYLDIGDTVLFKYSIKIAPPSTIESNIGSILAIETQQNLINQKNTRFCSNLSSFPLYTQWIEVNWWILSQNTYIPDSPLSHVLMPPEVIRTSYVQWIPAFYIYDVAFIFHHEDILYGKYANTHGVKNAFVCRSFLDYETNPDISSARSHPYFDIFDVDVAESYRSRVWDLIEKAQLLILSAMRRRGDGQKLHYRESISLSPFEWKILKSRFDDDCCLHQYEGCSTLYRYGRGLSQETVKRVRVDKEVILVENALMLQQLINAFGTCICSTVRSRFPPGPKVSRGAGVGHSVKHLKTDSFVNSFIELTLNDISNANVEFNLRKKSRGVDIRYDFGARKLAVVVRYDKLKSTDVMIRSFYEDVVIEAAEPQRPRPAPEDYSHLINSEFEAFDSLFLVTSISENNLLCTVTEGAENELYVTGSSHTFTLAFVQQKINEYLE